jgi:hypothetical protein
VEIPAKVEKKELSNGAGTKAATAGSAATATGDGAYRRGESSAGTFRTEANEIDYAIVT